MNLDAIYFLSTVVLAGALFVCVMTRPKKKETPYAGTNPRFVEVYAEMRKILSEHNDIEAFKKRLPLLGAYVSTKGELRLELEMTQELRSW